MECQKCGIKLANVHIVQEINGKHQELFLCSECANAVEKMGLEFSLGIDGGFPFAFHNFLPGFIGYSKNMTPSVPKELICEACGLTFEEFQRIGKLGCGSCYTALHEKLSPIITRIHGNVEYRGKKPQGIMNEKMDELEVLKNLKKDLQEAVLKEEYEKAAKIRDAIRELEGKKMNE